MSLTNTKNMFKKALAEGYAIPAFNICNLESAQAVLEIAGEKNAPVIISVSEGAAKYAGYDYLRAIVEVGSKKYLHHKNYLKLLIDKLNKRFLVFQQLMNDRRPSPYHQLNQSFD